MCVSRENLQELKAIAKLLCARSAAAPVLTSPLKMRKDPLETDCTIPPETRTLIHDLALNATLVQQSSHAPNSGSSYTYLFLPNHSSHVHYSNAELSNSCVRSYALL